MVNYSNLPIEIIKNIYSYINTNNVNIYTINKETFIENKNTIKSKKIIYQLLNKIKNTDDCFSKLVIDYKAIKCNQIKSLNSCFCNLCNYIQLK